MKLKSKLLLAVAAMSLAVSHQARGDDGAGAMTGRYWFDQSATLHPFTPGHLEISTSELPEGLHSLNAYVRDANGTTSSVVSQWFVKTMSILPGLNYKTVVFVDGKPLQTIENQASGYGALSFPLDMNTLPLGIHSLQAQVVSPSGIASDVKQTLFVRVPTTAQLATMKGYYTLDGKLAGELAPAVNGGVYHLDIDASILTSGLHSVSVYMASPVGLITSMNTAWFIKTPQGGEGVKSYEYWLNDNPEHTQVTLDKVANPMQLVSLMDVPEQSFRTTSYAFAVEDRKPVVYPLNDFHIRFLDPDTRITEGSSSYIDVRGRSEVSGIQVVEAPLNVFAETIADGDIKWYSFEGEIGDSVATRLSGAGMLELYGPDGTKLLARSGVDATTIGTKTLTANGTHYLAVHDIQHKSKKADIILDHISRFAICSFTPEKSASTDMLLVQIIGNGFDNLKEAKLVGMTGAYTPTEIVVADNYYLSLLFETENSIPLGEYNIQCIFTDDKKGIEEKIISNKPIIIEVPDAKNVTVLIKDSPANTRPFQAWVEVTNPSNIPYYCVPLNVAIPDYNGETYFVGFPEYKEEGSEWSIFGESENILCLGESGKYVSALIPYLGPGETRRFSIAFDTWAWSLKWYAWCDTPWSVQMKEIVSEDYDLEQIKTMSDGCFLTVRDIANMYYTLGNFGSIQDGIIKAPSNNPLVRSVNAAAGTTKQAVGVAARGGMNPTATRRMGNEMRQQMTGGNDAVAQMINTDGGMLYSGEALVAASETNNNMIGHAESLGWLAEARQRWHNAVPWNQNSTPHNSTFRRSWDPNDMHGYKSPSGDNYVGLDVKILDYAIEFENDPELANASATRIKVDNELDGKLFDLSTFKAAKMIIGSKETDLPEGHHFVKTLDMRPEINSIAELTFDYDATEGTASWSIRTLDPMTLEPTQYMDDGVLPVNDGTGRGIGFLTYTIGLREGLADGTEIANKAVIVFDDNDPIETPVYKNVTDYTRPEARIVSRTTEDGLTHTFEVEGSDSGSGVWYYDLYMRRAGSGDWTLVKPQIETETFEYTSATATDGADWAIVAVDRAGNSQTATFLYALAGDADGNGAIDASDVVVIRNYYMDSSVQINKANADVNVDTSIDAQDAAITRNLYLGEDILKSVNKTRRK